MVIIIACIIGIIITSVNMGRELMDEFGCEWTFFSNLVMLFIFILILAKTINF